MAEDNTQLQEMELREIRPTDNSARPEDGVQPKQVAAPLELNDAGFPVDIVIGKED